ncbi:MAG: M48 family metalloprotease [Methanoregula sp.]|nr:M48 family metalloprotease [Methanoregula sp.]
MSFDSIWYTKEIIYDPDLASLPEDEIKFGLLHEVGHIEKDHRGSICRGVIFAAGLSLIGCSVWLNLGIFGSIFGIFLLVFSTMLSSKVLANDEFQSDIFAGNILRNRFKIMAPSTILASLFSHLKNIRDQSNKSSDGMFLGFKIFKKLINIVCYLFLESHYPHEDERIANLKYECDNKE